LPGVVSIEPARQPDDHRADAGHLVLVAAPARLDQLRQ